jgi:hypothetical protein
MSCVASGVDERTAGHDCGIRMTANRHARILEDLGGHQRVAGLLRLKLNTVSKWRTRGIPACHWHRIIALSPGLTADMLARTKPRRTNGQAGE